MALSDRVRGLAGWAGARLHAFSTQQSPRVPGVGLDAGPSPAASPKALAVAQSTEALLGMLSYGAGPSLTRYSFYPATGINPALIYEILREADLGIVYRYADMSRQVLERDAHLAGVDRARRVEVSGKPFRVQPFDETPLAQALANFVRAAVDGVDSFDRACHSLLGANAIGWAANEIVWASSSVRFPGVDGKPAQVAGLLPRELAWVHPKHFWFERTTDAPLLDLGPSGKIPLPRHKFIFHPAADDGLVENRGFMRSCVWLHMLKHNSIRDWAVFLSLFGVPNIYAMIPRSLWENDQLKTIIKAALRDYGQGKPAVIPDDTTFKADAGPIGSGAADVHARMVAFCNQEMSKRVQGETLTTEMSGTGSYNASETHEAVKHAIVVADAATLDADIRSDLFASIIEINLAPLARAFGAPPDELRRLVPFCSRRIEREVTPLQRAQILDVLVNQLGLAIDEVQIRQEFNVDAPQPGSRPLRGAPVTVAQGGAVAGTLDATEGLKNPPPDQPAPAQES